MIKRPDTPTPGSPATSFCPLRPLPSREAPRPAASTARAPRRAKGVDRYFVTINKRARQKKAEKWNAFESVGAGCGSGSSARRHLVARRMVGVPNTQAIAPRGSSTLPCNIVVDPVLCEHLYTADTQTHALPPLNPPPPPPRGAPSRSAGCGPCVRARRPRIRRIRPARSIHRRRRRRESLPPHARAGRAAAGGLHAAQPAGVGARGGRRGGR